PLRVRAAGFSTPDAATPALPPDGLPVGAGLGAPREISHLRLAGTGTVLTLAVDTASSVGDAAVRACPHRTADWKAGRPQAVVPFDGADCVPGVRTGDVVSFNLAGFSDRAGPAGFALVVAPTTATVSATFRLVLRPTAPGAMS
ncbi:MAG: hypothetical protein H7323_17485, partial [Frankiales bacterium]|nr:hypothetical protein [Frankiales bacterium]